MDFRLYLEAGTVPQGYNDWFAVWRVGTRAYDPSPRESVVIGLSLGFSNVPPGPGNIEVLLRVVDQLGNVTFESGWLRSPLVTPDAGSIWGFDATSGLFRQLWPDVITNPAPPAQAKGFNVQYSKVQVSSG